MAFTLHIYRVEDIPGQFSDVMFRWDDPPAGVAYYNLYQSTTLPIPIQPWSKQNADPIPGSAREWYKEVQSTNRYSVLHAFDDTDATLGVSTEVFVSTVGALDEDPGPSDPGDPDPPATAVHYSPDGTTLAPAALMHSADGSGLSPISIT